MDKFNGLTTISMYEFITNYLNLDNLLSDEAILLLSKATHKDLKELNLSYVKTIPYEAVNKADVLEGRVILVCDGKSSSKNKRIAPYIRPQILKDEIVRKEEADMVVNKEKELLFRKDKEKENYQLFWDIRQEFPVTLEVGIEEIGIVLIYPDGGIDVVPFDGKTPWHLDYYEKLLNISPRFASVGAKTLLELILNKDYNTYILNLELASQGIIAIHNVNVHDLVHDKNFLDNYHANLNIYLSTEFSQKQEEIKNLIFQNYPKNSCNIGLYNKETNMFDDPSVELDMQSYVVKKL